MLQDLIGEFFGNATGLPDESALQPAGARRRRARPRRGGRTPGRRRPAGRFAFGRGAVDDLIVKVKIAEYDRRPVRVAVAGRIFPEPERDHAA